MTTNETMNGANAQAPKKARRGISNETRSTTELKFRETDVANNSGLFLAHVDSVKVDYSTTENNKDFPNMPVPRLTVRFASNHEVASERRFAYMTFFPIASSVDTIPGGKEEWKFNNMFGYIKHILEVLYLNGRPLTPEEEDALTLPFDDTDDEGNYVPVEPETVLTAYGVWFKNIEAMLNGSFNLADGATAKPCFNNPNGTPVALWMKLIRCKRVGKGSQAKWTNVANGELGFDSFVGNGVIERFVSNKAPKLFVDAAKETLRVMQIEEKTAPSIGVPGMGAPAMGGETFSGAPAGNFAEAPGMPF